MTHGGWLTKGLFLPELAREFANTGATVLISGFLFNTDLLVRSDIKGTKNEL